MKAADCGGLHLPQLLVEVGRPRDAVLVRFLVVHLSVAADEERLERFDDLDGHVERDGDEETCIT
jgi:hypothetical protein